MDETAEKGHFGICTVLRNHRKWILIGFHMHATHVSGAKVQDLVLAET